MSQLPTNASIVNQPQSPAAGLPIAELPQSRPEPLKQINQVGQLPTQTTTLTLGDTTPWDLDFRKLPDDAPVKLNLEQTTLRDVIDSISDALGFTTVIDPAIGDKVTMRSPPDKPLKKKDLWPLLQLMLSDAGVSMEKNGDVYHFKKTGPSIPRDVGVSPQELTSSTAPEVLQITPLRYISIESALAILAPVVQPQGRILSLPTLNVVGIVASPERLERVNKLLALVDADPFVHRGMRLFRLLHSKASEIQADLDKILKAIAGNLPAYHVVPLDRINAVLVVAPPGADLKEVASWVDILDERSEDTGEQIFIYRVKNLEAKNLAATLTDVFKKDNKKKEDEKPKRKEGEKQKPQQPQLPPQPPEIELPELPGSGKLAVSAELKVNIVADENTNSLLIRTSPRDYRQLLETIFLLDQMPKEVMINVVIAEVQLTEATRFGIDWQLLFSHNTQNRGSVGTNLNVPASNFFGNTTSGTTTSDTSSNVTAGLEGFIVNYASGSLNINALLNFVASTNDITILSRPSILVRNNQEASMNVGSNEPFLSGINTSTINNSLLSNDVQYKDTGITLKVTPRISDDGTISMKIYQEVSQLGPGRTTQNLQSFTQRKVETSVVVRDNSAIVIGGLIETRNKNNEQGIPVLKNIPYVGKYVFSSTDKEQIRTELVLIIVPEIVNPQADNTVIIRRFLDTMKLVSDLLNQEQIFPTSGLSNKPVKPTVLPPTK
ncbi:MAG: type II secretion system protein GspD [Beggiatoa sp. IS2]|nr:MAG: type II secretion system protein GspD [Beggiatoa sp. IS2]